MIPLTLCVAWLGASLHQRIRVQDSLMQALQSGTLQLRGVVSTMMAGSTAVASAGSTMSVSAQSLAIRTDQQGDQLETTTQAVRVVVGQVGNTAEHVSRVDERRTALREQTRSGTAVVARGVAAIEGIATGVEAVADDMRAVTAESHSQSDLLRRVMQGLDDLSQITRSNADMVAESVMAAEEMREHANRLREVVAEIEQDITPAAPAANTVDEPTRQAGLSPDSAQAVSATRQLHPPAATPSVPAAAQPAKAAEGVEFF